MNIRNIATILIAFTTLHIFSQEIEYTSNSIPDHLKQNANAVVRSHKIHVALNSPKEMQAIEERVITVLNKKGDDHVDTYMYYDGGLKIKRLEVLVYDDLGKIIKKVKKNDFRDVSAVDGGTLYSDSRVKYFEYTPIKYPYTIVFKSEMNTSNTAFIQPFMPVSDYFLSVEHSAYTIDFPETITLRKKEENLDGFEIVKDVKANSIFYEIKNIEAVKPEHYSPSFRSIVPKVLFSSKQFTLEGVQTEVENWDEFGKWMYNDLIRPTDDIPESTITRIKNLVKDEKEDIDKAKKIYKYIQDKVRYISVQVGIGGWKPFNTSQIDELGYGDCKGLTNYTMSLLNAVGIQSNYSVVYAGRSKKNIQKDFASIQGNHVILNIPRENEDDIWLECTSQKLPFGFIGDFTDDRDVLVITPEGGKIKHTKKYTTQENTQNINGHYSISNNGAIDVKVNISSKGIQYDDKYWLETETQRDLDVHYKKRWKYVNNMHINSMTINNDKDNIEFNENIVFNASNYSKIIGDRMLLSINALNRNTHIPDRYRNRKLPLLISRGFKDIDVIEIKLPENFKAEMLPEIQTIENKFGTYKAEVIIKDENTLIYKREFVVNDGEFPKEDYNAFRNFYKEVAKFDNTKIELIKNQK